MPCLRDLEEQSCAKFLEALLHLPYAQSHAWEVSCVSTAVENISYFCLFVLCPLVKKYLFSVCYVSGTSLYPMDIKMDQVAV